MKYYKMLDPGGEPRNGGSGAWSLPVKNSDGTWTPGDWREVEGALEPCKNGLHLCTIDHVLEWAGPELYEAEYDGEMIDAEGKIVVRRARLLRRVETWNERTLRLFAVWCARQALDRIDDPDPLSIEACDVAERCANGLATDDELSAARNAARDAAWSAARDAAWSAARDAARNAAWSAARNAAWSAARNAAWSAAWSAQMKRLREMLDE